MDSSYLFWCSYIQKRRERSRCFAQVELVQKQTNIVVISS
jgi:hypothetical protein